MTSVHLNGTNQIITNTLNGMVKSISKVISNEMSVTPPFVMKPPFTQSELGVLIGVTGDLAGQVLMEGENETFQSISRDMYGMELTGEMLESFTGELGNMLSGHMVTHISTQEITVDISPPTVIVGHSKYTAFEKSICLPIVLTKHGKINIYMMLKGENFDG